MTHKEFCIWLEGYLSAKGELSSDDVNRILDKLKTVKDINSIPLEMLARRSEFNQKEFPKINVPPIPNAPRIICEEND